MEEIAEAAGIYSSVVIQTFVFINRWTRSGRILWSSWIWLNCRMSFRYLQWRRVMNSVAFSSRIVKMGSTNNIHICNGIIVHWVWRAVAGIVCLLSLACELNVQWWNAGGGETSKLILRTRKFERRILWLPAGLIKYSIKTIRILSLCRTPRSWTLPEKIQVTETIPRLTAQGCQQPLILYYKKRASWSDVDQLPFLDNAIKNKMRSYVYRHLSVLQHNWRTTHFKCSYPSPNQFPSSRRESERILAKKISIPIIPFFLKIREFVWYGWFPQVIHCYVGFMTLSPV